MLRKSLDCLAESPLVDPVDGGFFRYSSTADWSEPQREKLLEDNVQVAKVFLDAAIIMEEPRYRNVAESAFDYLARNLYDPESGGFSGSEGANSDYFAFGRDSPFPSRPAAEGSVELFRPPAHWQPRHSLTPRGNLAAPICRG